MMDNIKQKVEDLGVVFEKFGRTHMEARVFSYLLISEPPFQTFDEIREFLGASKSAISNTLNFFLKEGTVAYKTYSGDRKRYFYVNAKEWETRLEDSAKHLFALNALLSQVLEHRKDSEYQKFNNGIKNIFDFQEYLSKVLDAAIIQWKNKA